MTEQSDWEEVRELETRIQRGEPLALTETVKALLLRAARQVAIPDDEASKGLRSSTDAVPLVMEISRRIREGSRRLSRVLVDAERRRAAGDVKGARGLLESVLAVEVVPLYRRSAQTTLDALHDPED
jgi:DUSAM domain-containing protein